MLDDAYHPNLLSSPPKIFELKAKFWFQGSLWVLKNCGFLFFNFSPLNNPISERSLQRWLQVMQYSNTLKNSVNIQKSTAMDYFHSHLLRVGYRYLDKVLVRSTRASFM